MNNLPSRLPSLDPLKGFDAAARHLSFTRAAQELFLTQSAISRQIQTLEEQLGVRLFRRATRRLELTPEGARLHGVVVEVLERLDAVCASLRSTRRRPRVNVTAAVSIVSLWLMPRIAGFQEIAPDVDVRFSADNRVLDLEREDIDLAVRYIAPEAAPAGSVLLFEDVVFPVASPVMAERLPKRLDAASLADLTLLAFETEYRAPEFSWEPWLTALGLAGAKPKTILEFNQYDQLIRAAEDGRGIALGRGPLVEPLIAAGRLCRVFDSPQRRGDRAYFLVRAQRPARSEVDRFADWLLEEARRTAVLP